MWAIKTFFWTQTGLLSILFPHNKNESARTNKLEGGIQRNAPPSLFCLTQGIESLPNIFYSIYPNAVYLRYFILLDRIIWFEIPKVYIIKLCQRFTLSNCAKGLHYQVCAKGLHYQIVPKVYIIKLCQKFNFFFLQVKKFTNFIFQLKYCHFLHQEIHG